MTEITRTSALDPAELDGLASFRELEDRLSSARSAVAGGLWGSSQSLVLARLVERRGGTFLIVVSSESEAEAVAADLRTLGLEPTPFPVRETTRAGGAHADPATIRARLSMAQRMAGPAERRPRLIVCSLLSLLQPIPSPSEIEGDFLHLQTGNKLDSEALLERLVAGGYRREPLAEKPGEVSVRGDILDVFPFAADLPLRIELFDDEIESLRSFDPGDQRSVESSQQVSLCLAHDAGGVQDGSGTTLPNLLFESTTWVELEPLRIEDQEGGLRLQSSAHARALDLLRQARNKHPKLSLQSLPSGAVDFQTRSVQGLAVGIRKAPEALRALTLDGTRVHILCVNEGEQHRFRTVLEEAGFDAAAQRVETPLGNLTKGFRLPDLQWAVVNHRELAGVEVGQRTASKKSKHASRALQSFFELRVGDLVVHAVHGLARYAGLERMPRGTGEEEHLHLIFEDEVNLYVPSSRVDLVQRYIGSGSKAPKLDKVGGQSFRKRKEKVGLAVADLAAELLEVQAKREMHQRKAWQTDDEMLRDLLQAFPWQDTVDQATVDTEIATDLASERPMDRLLCGDVGFGKTELAVRAAFRVVSGGGQVALLVPTTVLASQHERTFRERLSDFPVEVAMVSRHQAGKRFKEIAQGAADGSIDILIGTHKLLSKKIEMANLGLVIIDEEQRFGVTHKEHFKKFRATVDMLTLSATPIPRTLHMSLAGLRDISALTVAPDGRQDIETLLVKASDRDAIREALLREKNRDGQVFFLHNRVTDIHVIERELMALVPECRFLVGHGQMGGTELRKVMDAFTRHEADVLIATTIIENGIDIPTAGTILIHRAESFGLSELHQLRGRVGRGNHKSYCYLLVDETKPMNKQAQERLKALEEMNQLGAGFGISMRDLEIRGAGNLLGPEQSGHIAAIGYDMYCRLLKQTVESIQASGGGAVDAAVVTAAQEADGGVELELGLRAFLPSEWIPSSKSRLEILRQLDSIRDAESASVVESMLRDRFGRIPEEALALLRQFRLRAALLPLRIRRLSWREDHFQIEFSDRVLLEQTFSGQNAILRPIRTGLARLEPKRAVSSPQAALDWFEGLLNLDLGVPKMPRERKTTHAR